MNDTRNNSNLSNIHINYSLSNDLFRTFLDKEKLMYPSVIYDTMVHPNIRYFVVLSKKLGLGSGFITFTVICLHF